VSSTLPEGLAALEVERDAEGRGTIWSEVLLNLLIKSLNEAWRDRGPGREARADGPKLEESDVERYICRRARDDSKTFVGSGDTLSPICG
jgi:hypothetical protein